MPKKVITIERDGFTLNFQNGQPGEVNVDVFHKGNLLIEWGYPKIPGHTTLAAHATFWANQAIVQAQAELGEEVK